MTDNQLSEFAKAQAKSMNMSEEEYRAEMRRRSSKNKPENRFFSRNPEAAKRAGETRWKNHRKKVGGDVSG